MRPPELLCHQKRCAQHPANMANIIMFIERLDEMEIKKANTMDSQVRGQQHTSLATRWRGCARCGVHRAVNLFDSFKTQKPIHLSWSAFSGDTMQPGLRVGFPQSINPHRHSMVCCSPFILIDPTPPTQRQTPIPALPWFRASTLSIKCKFLDCAARLFIVRGERAIYCGSWHQGGGAE